mmetsp:Transcript_10145/g.28366  ORF Transcript_10145/g.28366 Transcript_10145/m.28366 type:complete len:282 (-) Transcript_10145:167-1012(-)
MYLSKSFSTFSSDKPPVVVLVSVLVLLARTLSLLSTFCSSPSVASCICFTRRAVSSSSLLLSASVALSCSRCLPTARLWSTDWAMATALDSEAAGAAAALPSKDNATGATASPRPLPSRGCPAGLAAPAGLSAGLSRSSARSSAILVTLSTTVKMCVARFLWSDSAAPRSGPSTSCTSTWTLDGGAFSAAPARRAGTAWYSPGAGSTSSAVAWVLCASAACRERQAEADAPRPPVRVCSGGGSGGGRTRWPVVWSHSTPAFASGPGRGSANSPRSRAPKSW